MWWMPGTVVKYTTDTDVSHRLRRESNRDMCISVINSMDEWQLQSVLEMLKAVKGTIDRLEAGVLETKELPSMSKKLIDGKNTPLSECVPESEVDL